MKIFIDIGHPAHVHYFRNFIKVMNEKGHEFFITARNKEVTHELLNYYRIPFKSRGNGRRGYLGKFLYIFEADYKLLKEAKKFNPDLFLSFSSSYAAQVSKIMGKPHIAFDDTEHAKYEHLMYVPFTDCIITPFCFKKDFGKKHIRFKGTMDLAYLHPKYFFDDTNYLKELNLTSTTFFILRFVSFNASHDRSQKGISNKYKSIIIDLLKDHGRVLISSEYNLSGYEEYLYKGNPAKIHTLMKHANLFVGESGSMATEAAILGTSSVIMNSSIKFFGVFDYLNKYKNLYLCENEEEMVIKIQELLQDNCLKDKSTNNSTNFISDNINVTDFMVWFVENYPESHNIMQKKPDYQFNFR
jgi:hypothetical protein